MCYKTILKNSGMLMFISNCYMDQKMYKKAVDSYHHALRSVPNWYKTQYCVTRLSVLILKQCKYFLICLRFTKCMIKLLIFVINIFLNKKLDY